jgi:hypothetical protein
MENINNQIYQEWQYRLQLECSHLSECQRSSIWQWLAGVNPNEWENWSRSQIQRLRGAMDCRFHILTTRYLQVSPDRAYKNFMAQLGNFLSTHFGITTSRYCQRTIVAVIEKIVGDMLQHDAYLQSQVEWIGKCANNRRLRESLVLSTIEDYCLHQIGYQHLLTYGHLNYFLQESQADAECLGSYSNRAIPEVKWK